MTKTAAKKLKKTTYYDEKKRRYIVVVWDGSYARHHELPCTIHSETEAKKIAKGLDLSYHRFD